MNLKRTIAWLLAVVLFIQISACGTILYPERRGQSAVGGVDVTVALLDAVGLLFGLVPGVIAFAIDFSTGAIYLPAHGHALAANAHSDSGATLASYDDTANYRIIQVDQDQLNQAIIEQIIYQETGNRVNLSDDDVRFIKLDNIDQVVTMLN